MSGKKYTASGIVAELLTLLETVTADGVVTEVEAEALKDWLDLNKTEQNIPGIEFLRTTVNQVLTDGKVTPEEKLALYKAVERVLPTEARRQARERRTAIEAVQKAHRRDARNAQSEQRRLETKSRAANVNFMVAGVTHEGRAPIVRRYVREDVPAFLARDPDNPHDCNAIEIRLDNGHNIGFMPRDYAESVAPFLDAGCRLGHTSQRSFKAGVRPFRLYKRTSTLWVSKSKARCSRRRFRSKGTRELRTPNKVGLGRKRRGVAWYWR